MVFRSSKILDCASANSISICVPPANPWTGQRPDGQVSFDLSPWLISQDVRECELVRRSQEEYAACLGVGNDSQEAIKAPVLGGSLPAQPVLNPFGDYVTLRLCVLRFTQSHISV